MRCRQYQQLLSPYLDDELSISERERLSTHLRECTVCKELLRQFESTRQLLRSFPAREVTPVMTAQLQERLKQIKTPSDYQQETTPFSNRTHTRTFFLSRMSSWRHWGRLSIVGTLATAAAAIAFYIAAPLERQDPVTAVTLSNQLLEALDYDQKTLSDKPSDIPTWPEEPSAWDSDDE